MKNLARLLLGANLILFLALASIGCSEDEMTTDPGPTGIGSAAFPDDVANLSPTGGPAVGALTGGAPPYSISTAPDPAVATADLSGANNDTLTITPVAVGTTSVVIADTASSSNDSPTAMVTITINVTEGGGGGTGLGGSGTFSVTSSVGNFSASGAYVDNATSGQGVGGIRTTTSSADQFYAFGYVARSASDFDIAFALVSYPNGALMNATYPFIPTGGGMFGSFGIAFGVSPENIEQNLYLASSGNGVNLTSITATNAAGNASGSGYLLSNPTTTFTFEGANFNVNNYGTGSAQDGPIRIAVEKAVQKMIRKLQEANK